MKIDLRIGGYGLRLEEPEDYPSRHWPLEPFDPFLAPSEVPPDIDLTINVVRQLPEISLDALLFDSCHGLWKLYEASDGYVLECVDPKTLSLRSRTKLSRDFSRGAVWLRGRSARQRRQLGWAPVDVLNPIAEICLVTRLAREGGILLHAAGVLTERGGWVFTGPSGAGKSTLTDFFAATRACALCDERVIIRNVAGEFTVFGTPWPGTGRQPINSSGSLTALCCITHGRDAHVLHRMSAREASQFVLQQSFLPHWDRDAMDRTLEFLVELVERVDCYGLAFVKNPDVVEYLAGRSLGGSLVPS